MSAPSQPFSPFLSLCMIVRNNAGTIIPCLESARPWFDEIIVVDTGSTDDTPEIAARLGAKVFHFPWVDDFSAARNESLRHATGTWLFWMDSDDTISPENGRKLRELVFGEHPSSIAGYVIQVHCPPRPGELASDRTVVDHVKLFRNDPAFRFEDRVHEQILPSIRGVGGEIGWTDIFVTHSGSDQSPAAQRIKCERDLRLLLIQFQERPNYTFGLFNLGMTYSEMGEHELAIGYLERCLELSDPMGSPVRKVFALLAGSYAQLNRWDRALEICQSARRYYPRDPELLFREGLALLAVERFVEAERSFRAAMRNDDVPHFASIDAGIVGYKSRQNLAATYERMGRFDLSEFQLRQVLDEVPANHRARRTLVSVLLRQGRTATADAEITQWLVEHPDETAAWDARSEYMFERGSAAEAEEALRQLIARRPDDFSAYHNLGMVFLREGQFDSAAQALRASLLIQPENQIVGKQLGLVLESAGRDAEAADFWMEAIHRWPDDPEIRQAIARLEQKQVAFLPPCHSRRFLRAEPRRYFCAHPMVYSNRHVVTSEICRMCHRWQEPAPGGVRPFPGPDYLKRNGACANLGAMLEERQCTTCRGNVRIKVYGCAHPNHKETTIPNCDLCSDYRTRETGENPLPIVA